MSVEFRRNTGTRSNEREKKTKTIKVKHDKWSDSCAVRVYECVTYVCFHGNRVYTRNGGRLNQLRSELSQTRGPASLPCQ